VKGREGKKVIVPRDLALEDWLRKEEKVDKKLTGTK